MSGQIYYNKELKNFKNNEQFFLKSCQNSLITKSRLVDKGGVSSCRELLPQLMK